MLRLSHLKKRYCWLWKWNKNERKDYRNHVFDRSHFNTRHINTGQHASDVIFNELQKHKPCLITRFGWIELRAIEHFYRNRYRAEVLFPERRKKTIKTNAGFFSNSDELISKFCCDALQILPSIDVLGVQYFQNGFLEQEIFEAYNKTAKLVYMSGLIDSNFNVERPWTRYLQGKKVLVLHPFENTIRAQYEKRISLFKNPHILPEFDLKVIKVVQGIGGDAETKQYKDWFDALESMYRKIDQCDFDIAIVSGGAYGMFLANYIKNIGKQAVHGGGPVQLLFGIKGSRWIDANGNGSLTNLINEHWTFPLEEDTPKQLGQFIKVEGGIAYW